MAGCSDISRRLGLSKSTVERAISRGHVPASRNARGEYEIDDDYAEALRPEDLLVRQGAVSPRASLLGALDAVREVCRALGVGLDPAPALDAARLQRARSEALRARRDLEHAAGVSGRSSRREGP